MINDDTMRAAEEAFGSYKHVEPYIGMKMKTGKKYTELHDKIYQAYKRDHKVVDDQALLFGTLFEPLWDYSLTPTENLIKLPRDSNVCRRRQELHEAGLIEYSPKAMKTRTEAFKKERDKACPIHPALKTLHTREEVSNEQAFKNERDKASPIPPQMKNIAHALQQEHNERRVDALGEAVFEQSSLL